MNQRKKPVQRLYNGLVGLPPEPEASLTPESVPPISKTTEFVDLALVCVDCNAEFLCTAEDQTNSSSEPLRCNSCRERHREIAEQSSKAVKTDAEKEAARQRARRRTKQEQLAEIKKRLKVPIAQVKAAAEARAKAIARPGSMNQGRYMPDAPTGKGELQTGGYGSEKLGTVAAARGRGVVLGSHTIDPETNEAVWPDNDRREVKPQGVGQQDNEKSPIQKTKDDLPVARVKFVVKLNDVDRERVVRELVYEYVEEDESGALCRLCQTFITGSAAEHITVVHGDENEPAHNDRFGDLIDAYIKREERKEARLRKAGHDKALEEIADTKARAEADATRAGYVKLNGQWVPKPRTA